MGGGPTILIPQPAKPAAAGLAEYRRAQVQAPQPSRDDPAWKKAVEFEAVFLSQMLEHMFTETEAEAPFGGGHAEETWKSVMNQEYGRAIAQAGGIGIASQVYQQILRLQEV